MRVGIAVFVQDLSAFSPERARGLHRKLIAQTGAGLEAVYALAWPDYEPPASPVPQANRAAWHAWTAEAGLPLWVWFNAQQDQAEDALAIADLVDVLEPAGLMLDIEGAWTMGAKLKTLITAAKRTGLPVRASLAAATPAHFEYDFRELDLQGVAVDWQSYFDSGEGCTPAVAVQELYRCSFVVGGWEYRHHWSGTYGWGKVGRTIGSMAAFDSYLHPGSENATFLWSPRDWGLTVEGGRLMKAGITVGQLMGRAKYANVRVTLDVTRGAAEKHTLEEWTAIAASARVPGSAKRPVSVYMAEHASDDVLLAIAKGAA
jgi:hypothetical protein